MFDVAEEAIIPDSVSSDIPLRSRAEAAQIVAPGDALRLVFREMSEYRFVDVFAPAGRFRQRFEANLQFGGRHFVDPLSRPSCKHIAAGRRESFAPASAARRQERRRPLFESAPETRSAGILDAAGGM